MALSAAEKARVDQARRTLDELRAGIVRDAILAAARSRPGAFRRPEDVLDVLDLDSVTVDLDSGELPEGHAEAAVAAVAARYPNLRWNAAPDRLRERLAGGREPKVRAPRPSSIDPDREQKLWATAAARVGAHEAKPPPAVPPPDLSDPFAQAAARHGARLQTIPAGGSDG